MEAIFNSGDLVSSRPRSYSYWCDAQQWLRSPASASQAYIAIPKEQRLDNTTREQLFAVTSVGSDAFLEVPDIMNHMMLARCPNSAGLAGRGGEDGAETGGAAVRGVGVRGYYSSWVKPSPSGW